MQWLLFEITIINYEHLHTVKSRNKVLLFQDLILKGIKYVWGWKFI